MNRKTLEKPQYGMTRKIVETLEKEGLHPIIYKIQFYRDTEAYSKPYERFMYNIEGGGEDDALLVEIPTKEGITFSYARIHSGNRDGGFELEKIYVPRTKIKKREDGKIIVEDKILAINIGMTGWGDGIGYIEKQVEKDLIKSEKVATATS